MKNFVILLGLAAILSTCPARAENVRNDFGPTWIGDVNSDWTVVDDARVGPPSIRSGLTWSHKPLVVEGKSGVTGVPVKEQATVSLAGSFALWNHLTIAAFVPLQVHAPGDSFSSFPSASPRVAMGDIIPSAGYTSKFGRLRYTIAGKVLIPTGSPTAYTGGHLRAGGSLTLATDWKKLAIAARGDHVAGDYGMGVTSAALAVGYWVHPKVLLGTETRGMWDLDDGAYKIQPGVSLNVTAMKTLFLHALWSPGIGGAVGVPAWDAMFAVDWVFEKSAQPPVVAQTVSPVLEAPKSEVKGPDAKAEAPPVTAEERPVTKVEEKKKIKFDSGKLDDAASESAASLTTVVGLLQAHPEILKVRIVASDPPGVKKMKERSKQIAKWLLTKGIDKERITSTVGVSKDGNSHIEIRIVTVKK